jgi:copper(I)-binding protein
MAADHSFRLDDTDMRITIIGFAALLALGTIAQAHDYKVGSLRIEHPWTRATPKGASVGGGYMKITNTGSEPDRLISGSSSIAGRFEVHEMSMDNGVMKMRMLKEGLEIKPGETVELKPGSFHIMMLDLKQPIVDKQNFKGTLVFQKAGTVEVEYAPVPVGASPGATQPGGGHSH